MNLNMWLVKNGLSKTQVARYLGVSRVYFTNVCHGYSPSEDLAIRIEHFTKGEISRYQIRPLKKRGRGHNLGAFAKRRARKKKS